MSNHNEIDRWLFIGDIHGDVDPIRTFYEKNKDPKL